MQLLVATDREVVVIDVERGTASLAHGIGGRPTCLTADPLVHGRAWCGTHRDGMFRSDDGGRSWQSVGLAGRLIMAVTASPALASNKAINLVRIFLSVGAAVRCPPLCKSHWGRYAQGSRRFRQTGIWAR